MPKAYDPRSLARRLPASSGPERSIYRLSLFGRTNPSKHQVLPNILVINFKNDSSHQLVSSLGFADNGIINRYSRILIYIFNNNITN